MIHLAAYCVNLSAVPTHTLAIPIRLFAALIHKTAVLMHQITASYTSNQRFYIPIFGSDKPFFLQ
jgi:hypothetical protein